MHIELFSLDEEPLEFNKDMYVAMRNRIFELEAKTVNYAPFKQSRKRAVDRLMDENYERGYGLTSTHGHDPESTHHSKRPTYRNDAYIQYHPSLAHPYAPGPTDGIASYRYPRSYPAWYTPETCISEPFHRPYQVSHPGTTDRERIQQRPANAQADYRSDYESRLRFLSLNDGRAARSTLNLHSAKHTPTAIKPRPSVPQTAGSAPGFSHTSHDCNSQPCTGSKPSATTSTGTTGQQQQQQQQRQSFHQRQHRAQQQAQSDYSRNYHLQKHLRMLDQQRAAQMAQMAQKQQQQHGFKIQRQYESHQQMYPASVMATQSLPAQHQEQQRQQESRVGDVHQITQQQHQTAQQQLIQRYQQHRLLQQKQQQANQLQSISQRTAGRATGGDLPTPAPPRSPRTLISNPNSGEKLEHSSGKKSDRPLECSNCMALEPFESVPRTGLGLDTSSQTPHTAVAPTRANGMLLCPTCMQFLQSHGKARPVPPFRVNFLKKIHCRFKRELQEVRFHGWQDAQVLEIEDRMTEEDFLAVFHAGVEEGLVITGSTSGRKSPLSSVSASESDGPVVIKIEDDSEMPSVQLSTEMRVFPNEASVGSLFGHRWMSEPMVGYTVVYFGGSDRARMVPMNPTIPTLSTF